MKTQILKVTLLAFIIFFSCHQVSQQHPILEQAEKVMSEHPDSALFLLETGCSPRKDAGARLCHLVFVNNRGS